MASSGRIEVLHVDPGRQDICQNGLRQLVITINRRMVSIIHLCTARRTRLEWLHRRAGG
jgi:hypothetical protein